MSYSIIFETKICKLSDGNILHLSLSGCNNDNEGRDRHEFRGKIYTPEAWEKYIKDFENTLSESWDLKIGSRYCTLADYGSHLRRMTKRAITVDEMQHERAFYGWAFDGVTYYPDGSGEPVEYPFGKECEKICDDVFYGRVKGYVHKNRHMVTTEAEITEALKKGQHVEFYISPKIFRGDSLAKFQSTVTA